MFRFAAFGLRTVAIVLAVLAASGLGENRPAGACDTPVYRYAMYRWNPAPYEVYCFHRGPLSAEQRAANELLEKGSLDEKNRGNVKLFSIDVDDEKSLGGLLPEVRQAVEELPADALPSYQIFAPPSLSAPQAPPVFDGNVDAKAVTGLIDSPARAQIAKLLGAGNAAVLLLLAGKDEAANNKAELAIRKTIDAVAKGEIGGDTLTADAESEQVQKPQHELAVVRVDHDDPAEQWLVRMLLAVENDLKEYDPPMVFPVYGRGRALPPFIGAGIEYDNLAEVVEFITGACSCTVKEQNPGVDLLIRHDWEKAAEAVAARFGSEEGNESQFADDFFPELIIPARQTDDPVEIATTDASRVETESSATEAIESIESVQVESTADNTPPADDTQPTKTAQTVDTEIVAEKSNDQPASQVEVSTSAVSADTPAPTEQTEPPPQPEGQAVASIPPAQNSAEGAAPAAEGGGVSGVMIIGIGVLVALAGLFGVTFLILKPR